MLSSIYVTMQIILSVVLYIEISGFVFAGSQRGSCICRHVWSSGPRLVGSLHDVVPCQAINEQILHHFCTESPEVDWTWGGVRDKTL